MEKRDYPAPASPTYSAEDFIYPLANLREAAKAGGYAGLAYFLDMCLQIASSRGLKPPGGPSNGASMSQERRSQFEKRLTARRRYWIVYRPGWR